MTRKTKSLSASVKRQAWAFFTLLGLFLGYALLPASALAGAAPPSTPCDPQYMDALEARAYLEAQREISQNQNLIYKPDSVLEYSCFEGFLNAASRNFGDRPFSESARWLTTGVNESSTDSALSNVVGSALSNYLSQNFPHTFLNGRTNADYSLSGVSGAAYSCGMMARVWDAAKCKNFFDDISVDAFFDFPKYASTDPRKYPPTSAACTPPGGINTALGIAFNTKQASHTLNPENPYDPAAYTEDPVKTYLDKILPKGVKGTTCADPIYTGVIVVRKDFNPPKYKDAVCPNPGCSYKPTSETEGKCE